MVAVETKYVLVRWPIGNVHESQEIRQSAVGDCLLILSRYHSQDIATIQRRMENGEQLRSSANSYMMVADHR